MDEKEKKKGNLNKKIIIGILIVLVLGVVAVLTAIFLFDNERDEFIETNEQENVTNEIVLSDQTDLLTAMQLLPDYEAVEFICIKLNGFWVFNDQFVAFIDGDEQQFIEYGLYRTGYVVRGIVQGAEVAGENTVAFTVLVPAVPATEMDDARPERTEIISIDLSTHAQDGRISIRINGFGNGNWNTYELGGKSLQEAFPN